MPALTLSGRISTDPHFDRRPARGPQSLSVALHERPLFAPAAGLLSYVVEITYTDEGNWDYDRLDLLEEVQAPGQPVGWRVVDLDSYRFDRPVVAAGLRALIRADISDRVVMAEIEAAIVEDMRRLDAEASRRRAA